MAYCPYCMSSSFCSCSEHFDLAFAECENSRVVANPKLVAELERKISEIDRQRERRKAAV